MNGVGMMPQMVAISITLEHGPLPAHQGRHHLPEVWVLEFVAQEDTLNGNTLKCRVVPNDVHPPHFSISVYFFAN